MLKKHNQFNILSKKVTGVLHCLINGLIQAMCAYKTHFMKPFDTQKKFLKKVEIFLKKVLTNAFYFGILSHVSGANPRTNEKKII